MKHGVRLRVNEAKEMIMKQPRHIVIDDVPFTVPPRIQRCGKAWQVRYLGTKLYSDGSGGANASFKAAVVDLRKRYKAAPPHVVSSLRDKPLSHKTSALPPGISGPVLAFKPGRAPYAEFKVSLPRKGKANAGTSVYIATESSWCAQRYDDALAKATRLRNAAVKRFQG